MELVLNLEWIVLAARCAGSGYAMRGAKAQDAGFNSLPWR